MGQILFSLSPVRFPNTVEPWTPKMFARLHDDVTSVRSNTLTVLAHLILIKVKGQISDIAFCIVDPIDKIAGLSKLFFAELAKKGNTLYNVMPDIVSRLSDSEVGIEEEAFRTVMRYIIGLIKKDKLQESLVEKLCHVVCTVVAGVASAVPGLEWLEQMLPKHHGHAFKDTASNRTMIHTEPVICLNEMDLNNMIDILCRLQDRWVPIA